MGTNKQLISSSRALTFITGSYLITEVNKDELFSYQNSITIDMEGELTSENYLESDINLVSVESVDADLGVESLLYSHVTNIYFNVVPDPVMIRERTQESSIDIEVDIVVDELARERGIDSDIDIFVDTQLDELARDRGIVSNIDIYVDTEAEIEFITEYESDITVFVDTDLTMTREKFLNGNLIIGIFGLPELMVTTNTPEASSVIYKEDYYGGNWTQYDVDEQTEDRDIKGVTYSPTLERWVIVGGGTGVGNIAYSNDDGQTWTHVDSLDNDDRDIRDVVWSDTREEFVAVGGVGHFWVSKDGINWTAGQTNTANETYRAIAVGSYIAAGTITGGSNQGTVDCSEDGITWETSFINPDNNTQLWGVYYANGVYVVVGQQNLDTNIWYNTECTPAGTDTVNGWTKSTMLSTGMDGVVYRSVAGDGSTFVAVGNAGWKERRILYSTDGAQNWYHADISALSSDDPRFRCVIWSGVDFVAVGETNLGPVVFRSPDGINWSIDNSVDPGSYYELLDVWANQNTAVGGNIDRERTLSSDIDIFVDIDTEFTPDKGLTSDITFGIITEGELISENYLESDIDISVSVDADIEDLDEMVSDIDISVTTDVNMIRERTLTGDEDIEVSSEAWMQGEKGLDDDPFIYVDSDSDLARERGLESDITAGVDTDADRLYIINEIEGEADIFVDTDVTMTRGRLIESDIDITVTTDVNMIRERTLSSDEDIFVDADAEELLDLTVALGSSSGDPVGGGSSTIIVDTSDTELYDNKVFIESNDLEGIVIGVTDVTTQKLLRIECGC
jgi:hypothetical protein